MSSRRAVWRWGWRLLRKEWRQQTLIIGLVLGIVTLSVSTSVLAYNMSPPSGGLDNVEGFTLMGDLDVMSRATALIGDRAGPLDRGEALAAGARDTVDILALDPKHPETSGLVELKAGDFPVGPNEIAITDAAASFLIAEIGSSVHLDDSVLMVTGLVEDPTNLTREFVFVDVYNPPPLDTNRFYVAPDDLGLLEAEGIRDLKRSGLIAGSFGHDQSTRRDFDALVTIVSTVGTMMVGLIISAAFAVVGRRRIRQFGLLGALGANERHLRGAAAFNGFLIGVFTAIAGLILGLSIASAALPFIEGALNHRIDYEVPIGSITLALFLAVSVSTAAAWWPARSIARQPITDALSARRPHARSVRNTTLAGIVATIVGWLFVAATLDPHGSSGVVVLGIVLTILGVMMLTPAAVSMIGSISSRAPLPVKVAGRDLFRFQGRAAAALGSVIIALSIPLAIGVVSASTDAGLPNMADNSAILWSEAAADRDDVYDGNLPLGFMSFEAVSLRAEIAATFPSMKFTPIEKLIDSRLEPQAVDLGQWMASTRKQTIDVACGSGDYDTFDDRGEDRCVTVTQAWVANPELLELWSIEKPGANVDLIARQAGTWGELDTRDDTISSLRSTDAALPEYASFPLALITESAIRSTDERLIIGWILTSPTSFTSDEISTLRSLMSDGSSVETTTGPTGRSPRVVAALIGTLVGLAVLASAVTLIRSESADDNRVLNVLGASSSLQRSLAASTAALLALGGAVLALPMGVLALIIDRVFTGAEGYPYAVPWSTLLILFILFPVLAAVGSGVLAPNTKELR